MSALLQAEPADVLQCALRVADASRAAQAASSAASRAGAAPWRGPAQRSFDAHLGAVRSDLDRVRSAYAEMADVVQAYGSALADAQATARRASALAVQAAAYGGELTKAQAEQRDAAALAARRLMAEAEEQERRAALRAAAELDAIARRAPRAGRLAGTSRFLDDVGHTLADGALGVAGLWITAAGAVPFLNGATRQEESRRELRAQAVASLRVWEPFVDAYRSGADGRWGQAVGGLAGVIVFRRGGRLHYVNAGRVERGQQKHAAAIVRRLEKVRPSPARSPYDPVRLLDHEAFGGHTLLEHVRRPDEYLAWRAHDLGGPATAFTDERVATAAVQQALRVEGKRVEDMMTSGQARLILTVDTRQMIGGGFDMRSPRRRETTVVRVVLDRAAGGTFVITSAFPLL